MLLNHNNMDNRIRLKEAFDFANQNGKNITVISLAKKMFPGSDNQNAYVKYYNIVNGKVKRIDKKTVNIICDVTGVSAAFLFGRKENN